jgi:hypothetical protein
MIRDGVVILVAVVLSFGGGYLIGKDDCEGDPAQVAPVIQTVTDTVEVPSKWMLDWIEQMGKEMEKKPRRDTLYLDQEVMVRDSFPYPVFVKDTTSRFWWLERATFGQKPGDASVVVTREPFSGRATVLRYRTTGPVTSFVIDTGPRPRIDFGTFSVPKKKHGFFTDLLLVGGSLGVGYFTGQLRCPNG